MPIIIVALACVGGVIVLNAASQFVRFGETVLTGDALSLSLLRELGPVFTALLVAGRNSTGMASQLGSTLVTEQVDAIRGLGIDPIRKLMTPRVLAAVLILPLLVAIGDCAGLFGGFIVATVTLHIDAQEFWTRAIKALVVGDLVIGFSKPVVFGFILATVGCYQGLRVEGGTGEGGPRHDYGVRRVLARHLRRGFAPDPTSALHIPYVTRFDPRSASVRAVKESSRGRYPRQIALRLSLLTIARRFAPCDRRKTTRFSRNRRLRERKE